MAQRNVYVPDALADLLEHELRHDPRNTPGKLLVALARESLLKEAAPATVTNAVLEALPLTAGASLPDLARWVGLSQRVVGETLALLSRLEPSPVQVVSGEGRNALWALADPGTTRGVVDDSDTDEDAAA